MALKKKTALKPTKEKKQLFTEEDLENFLQEYDNICEQIKTLDAKKKEIAEKLKGAAEVQGKEDEKGSFFLNSPSHVVGKIHVQSYTLNHEKGYEFCKKHDLLDCVSQVTTYKVDEQAIAQAVTNNKVTLDEVRQGMYNYKESYRILVKPKENEEMPEVETSRLKK